MGDIPAALESLIMIIPMIRCLSSIMIHSQTVII